MSSEPIPGKPKRRGAARPEPRQDEQPVKLTLTLPADLARRFGVHAEMLGASKSELFARLVRDGCKRFVVHDHGRDEGQGEAGAA